MSTLLAELRAKTVSIHQEPQVIARMPDHDLWLMWIKDSEDNLLGIMEERRTYRTDETRNLPARPFL